MRSKSSSVADCLMATGVLTACSAVAVCAVMSFLLPSTAGRYGRLPMEAPNVLPQKAADDVFHCCATYISCLRGMMCRLSQFHVARVTWNERAVGGAFPEVVPMKIHPLVSRRVDSSISLYSFNLPISKIRV